jgi:hypothetical protein
MSEKGHQAALKLPLSDNALRLVKAALGLWFALLKPSLQSSVF